MAQHLLGKPVADSVKEKLTSLVEKRRIAKQAVGFATVRVGDDPASVVYQKRLMKGAEEIGLAPVDVLLPAVSTEAQVIEALTELGDNPGIAGILLFMPLPKGLDSAKISAAIPMEKDVDCLNPLNFAQVMAGESPWGPCTARAVMEMLAYYEYDLSGKHVVVIGRSQVVGKPLAQLLLRKDATVTVCHSKTKDIKSLTQQADLVITAVGKIGTVTGEMLRPGAWVVDVGINPSPEGKGIVGDADFGSCEPVCEAISPVPGGVGGISVMMVMQALVERNA